LKRGRPRGSIEDRLDWKTGSIDANSVYAELGEIVTGRKTGRASDREITPFKSVGIAAEDIAAAAHVFEQAELNGLGTCMIFDGEAANIQNRRIA
jgi:ornithine cyclodeaminase/alanine dehydrogenase-like protein (mu-crystallin family)